MKSCSSSDCRQQLVRAKKMARATCVALTCAAGLIYLWNFEYKHTLIVAVFSIFALGCCCVFHCFWEIQNEGPKDGEVVVVTGCDTGLGYSLVLHLRSIGLSVVAGVHMINSPGAKELSAISGIFVHPLDLTSTESVTTFSNAVREYLDRDGLGKYTDLNIRMKKPAKWNLENCFIIILYRSQGKLYEEVNADQFWLPRGGSSSKVLRAFVNNAGNMIFGEFEWQTEEQSRRQIEVNLLGTMRVTRAFMPMIRAHSTRLIVVTSHCAIAPLPGVAVYGASKAALSAWATALRVELKKYKVDVVSFVPGSFIRESNLLSQQRRHFEVMESAMSEEARTFYGDYFTRYANFLSSLAPTNLPQKITNPDVYEVFENALFDRSPRAVYKCEPWRYTLYHSLFKVTPTWLRDRLVERFMQLPSWNDSDRINITGTS